MPLSVNEAVKKAKAEMVFQKQDLENLVNTLFYTIEWRRYMIAYKESLNFVERYFYRIPWLLEYLYATNRRETYRSILVELHSLEQRSIIGCDKINTCIDETIEMLKEALTTVDASDSRTYYALSQVIQAQEEFAHILRRNSCIHNRVLAKHVAELITDPQKIFNDALTKYDTKPQEQ